MMRKSSSCFGRLLTGAAITLGLPPAAAFGQDSSAKADSRIGEIVVTAQKREQNLQDVPIAITALNSRAVSDARIQNVEQISGLAPNVVTLPQIGGNQLAGFSIRGIVASNSAPESDNPVTVYVDGVYVGRPAGAVFDLADIDRIEVLRGPQGTLFGRNSTGGAISIVTSSPTGKFGGKLEGTVSNYNGWRVRARFDTPEWNGLSAQFVVLRNKRDGDVRNLGAGTIWDFTTATGGRAGIYRAADTLGSIDTTAFRAALKYKPTSALRIDYKFDYTLNKGAPGATANLAPEAVTAGTLNFLSTLFGGEGISGDMSSHPTRPDAINNWFTSNSHQKVQGHNLTATLKLTDNLTIKNIAAYRRMQSNSINQLSGLGGLRDIASGSPFLLVDIASENDFRQYSDELQVNYDTAAFNAVGGLYLFKENLRSGGPGIGQVFLFDTIPGFDIANGTSPFNGPVVRLADNKFVNRSTALFAQVTAHITPQVDLTLGGRYTWDNKLADYKQGPVLGTFHYRKGQFNYLANVTYRPSDEVMVYALTSSGYLSGGTVNGTPFNPEKVTNYEFGLKTDLFDRRLRFNAAAFLEDYKDLQFTIFPAGSAILLNAGKSQIAGAEAEVTVVPVSGVRLNAGLGYTHFTYKELDPSILATFGFTDIHEFTKFYRPEWTLNLGASYDFPRAASGWQASIAVDTQANAKYYTAITKSIRDATISPETWIVNARATVSEIPLSRDIKGRLQLWVKNLTNEKGITFAGDVFSGAAVAGFYRPARTYGIDFGVDF